MYELIDVCILGHDIKCIIRGQNFLKNFCKYLSTKKDNISYGPK